MTQKKGGRKMAMINKAYSKGKIGYTEMVRLLDIHINLRFGRKER